MRQLLPIVLFSTFILFFSTNCSIKATKEVVEKKLLPNVQKLDYYGSMSILSKPVSLETDSALEEDNIQTNNKIKKASITSDPKELFFKSDYVTYKKQKGSKNDTTHLIQYLKNNKKIYFPKGNYYFKLNSIFLTSNTTLMGDFNKTNFHVIDDGEFKSTKPSALLNAYGKKNIQIFNINFYGKNNTSVGIGIYSSKKIGNSKEVVVAYNNTNKMGLLWVGPSKGFSFNRIDENNQDWANGGPVTEKDISENIKVFENVITGDLSKKLKDFHVNQISGISLLFVKNAKIYNNIISHTYFGAWAYGGASRSSDESHLTKNPIWCKNIEFFNNTIDRTFSPMWASRCQNVNMYSNYTKENLDVALDFEGCFDSSAKYNTVINSHGGALTSLNGSNNIIFKNNTIESNHESVYGINITLIRNANENIKYLNNIFRATGFSKGKIQLTRTSETIGINKNIIFKNNIFENIYVNNKDGSDITIDKTNMGIKP